MPITGTSSNDILNGTLNADTLDGAAGADTLSGGAGNDSYLIDHTGDVVIEKLNEGIDTVLSTVSYTLPDNVENLVVVSHDGASVRPAATLTAIGNDLDNVITGEAVRHLAQVTYVYNGETRTTGTFVYDANVLLGGAGRDAVTGSESWDTIDGGTGADTMAGRGGPDVYFVDDVGDRVIEETNAVPSDLANHAPSSLADTVISSVDQTLGDYLEHLTLKGSAVRGTGNELGNRLIGNDQANVLEGFGGKDTLDGGAGADTMRGGAGEDTYLVDDLGDQVIDVYSMEPAIDYNSWVAPAYESIDQVISSVDFTLGAYLDDLKLEGLATSGTGNAGANRLIGSDKSNRLSGMGGADVIMGGAGEDKLIGGAGDDTLSGDAGADAYEIAMGGGQDRIHADAEDTLYLTDRRGSSAFQVFNAPNGETALLLTFPGSTDTVILDQQSQWRDGFKLVLSDGTAFTGAELIQAAMGRTMLGTAQADSLTGSHGKDTIEGLAGNDSLDGSLGADLLTGGLDDDQYTIDDAGDLVVEKPGEGKDTVISAIAYTLAPHVENLTLSGQALQGTGNELDNLLVPNNQVVDHVDSFGDRYGIHYFPFYAGNALSGAGGRDTLMAGVGLDTLTGGTGDDTYDLHLIKRSLFSGWQAAVVIEKPGEGIDNIRFSGGMADVLDGYVLPDEVEHFSVVDTASAKAVGNGLGNRMLGGGGSDTLQGGAGNDTLKGGDGNDWLQGDGGADTYLIGANDGLDAIVADGADQIVFDQGIGRSDVLFSRDGTPANGAVTLTIWGSASTADGASTQIRLEQVGQWDPGLTLRWADGTVLTSGALLAQMGAQVRTGTVRNDVLASVGGYDTVRALEGNDTLTGTGPALLIGGAGDDVYVVSRFEHVVIEQANEGRDTIISTGESQILSADVENLILKGDDYLSGTGNEHDNLLQADQADVRADLSGEAGADTLIASGNDLLFGGDGDDLLVSHGHGNFLSGGQGADTYVIEASAHTEIRVDSLDTLKVNGTTRSQVSVVHDGPWSSNLIVRFGSMGDAVLIVDGDQAWDGLVVKFGDGTQLTGAQIAAMADGQPRVFEGTSGDDQLIGAGNGDSIAGLAGHDTLDGGSGADTLAGGEGDDTYLVEQAGDEIVETPDAGIDTVISQVDWTLGANLENLTLAGWAANGTGNQLANVIKRTQVQMGDGGLLQGLGGNDTLSGAEIGDSLAGGAGDDVFEVQVAVVPMGFPRGGLAASVTGMAIEQANEGIDEVRLGGSSAGWTSGNLYVLPDHIENLTLADDVLSGSGNAMDNVLKANATMGQGSWLDGGAGRDTLYGHGGTDTLLGGSGGDVLQGGGGADTYVFKRGDGQDLIHADALDTIVLGADIARTDLKIGALGAAGLGTVQLGLGSTDSITLDNAGQWGGLLLKFADGSSLTGTQIMLEASKPIEPPKPVNLTLTGTAGKDLLTGKAGDDTLTGLAGSDTLAGGAGNDRLIGGKGGDTYLFNRGDGQDAIVENDTSLLNSLLTPDLLKVGSAKSNQLWLTKSGNNLDIAIIGTKDKVTIQDWYKGSANQVEKITALGDNKSLSASKVNALVTAMAKFSAPADGVTTLPAANQTALTKILASSWT